MEWEIKPVTAATWSDLETLFRARGGPKNCWFMVWRTLPNGRRPKDKGEKETGLREIGHLETPVGLLAYAEDEPIAWGSVGPRETFRSLGGVVGLEKVWSITCFFVLRTWRQQGLQKHLLEAAIRWAKENGAHYVEAYPVAPDSPSYRFMGFEPTFVDRGFTPQHKAGSRRTVMLKKLVH